MSDKTEELLRCREEFEKWHIETYDEKPIWNPTRNLYEEFGHHCAWRGWQAAIAALTTPDQPINNQPKGD